MHLKRKLHQWCSFSHDNFHIFFRNTTYFFLDKGLGGGGTNGRKMQKQRGPIFLWHHTTTQDIMDVFDPVISKQPFCTAGILRTVSSFELVHWGPTFSASMPQIRFVFSPSANLTPSPALSSALLSASCPASATCGSYATGWPPLASA